MMRIPFESVRSTGFGTVTLLGAAGGGGVSCGAGDWLKTVEGRTDKNRATLRIELGEKFI
jgi:hypothetical protein